MRNQVVAGSSVATTGWSVVAAAASASIPAADGAARWSAEAAPSSRGQLRAAGRRQLVGVQARRQAVRGRRLEDPPRLVRVEDALLAEDVAEPGPALGRDAAATAHR